MPELGPKGARHGAGVAIARALGDLDHRQLGLLGKAVRLSQTDRAIDLAGGAPDLFATETHKEIFRMSDGVPRLVNQFCEFAMIYAWSSEQKRVTEELVRQVLDQDPGYYGWMMNGDFPLYTKKVLTSIKLSDLKK